MLPFGLRSAPKIFNSVADAVEWCVVREGVEHIFHYLDDFAVSRPSRLRYLHAVSAQIKNNLHGVRDPPWQQKSRMAPHQ